VVIIQGVMVREGGEERRLGCFSKGKSPKREENCRKVKKGRGKDGKKKKRKKGRAKTGKRFLRRFFCKNGECLKNRVTEGEL